MLLSADGLIYRTSIDSGQRPFEVYDIAADTWTSLGSVDSVTSFGVSDDGDLYKLTGSTGMIQKYDANANSWSDVLQGPPVIAHQGNLEVTKDGEFVVTWNERIVGNAQAKTVYYTQSGTWNSFQLPGGASAVADYDPATHQLAVRRYRLHETYLVDMSSLSITTFAVGSGTQLGTTNRFGEIYDGRWYSQGWVHPIYSYDLSDNSLPFTESSIAPTDLSPTQEWLAGTVNAQTGTFYISGFNRGSLFRWDATTDTYTQLAASSISGGHDTLAFVGSLQNASPDAVADSYSVDEDSILAVGAATGVLLNDSDPDGDSLTVSLASGPSNGTLNLNGDGSFDYTPAANFNGIDSFMYEVSDGNGGTDTATVEITVNSVIDAVIDVKPGSDVNPVNLGSRGMLPVAVLSTQKANGELEDFDATTIDTDTIMLNGVAINPVHAAFEDVDGDGDLDLMLHFRMPELVDEGVLDENSTDLFFAAEYAGGGALGNDVGGRDLISLVPPNGKGKSGK